MYFLLISPLIKLQLGALINTPIVVTIEPFITKVIKIFNFNYILILNTSSKGFKRLIEFYIIHLTILEFINIIYSLLGIFQILTIYVVGYILIRLLAYLIDYHIIRSFKLINNSSIRVRRDFKVDSKE